MAITSTTIKITALHVSPNQSFDEDFDFQRRMNNSANIAEFTHCSNASFEQNVEPNWSSQAAYGKMDSIPFYSNSQRTLSVRITALAGTSGKKQTPESLANAVKRLLQFQYPVYANNNGVNTIFAPPFFKLEHTEPNGATSFAPVEGYITQLKINNGSDTGIKIAKSLEGHLFEAQVDISFVFEILHKKLPGWDQFGGFNGDKFFNFEGKNNPDFASINRPGKPFLDSDGNTDISVAVRNSKNKSEDPVA